MQVAQVAAECSVVPATVPAEHEQSGWWAFSGRGFGTVCLRLLEKDRNIEAVLKIVQC